MNKTRTIHKILIANRGEIAIRIIRACQHLGLDFVCVTTKEDTASGHCRLAVEVGGEQALYTISSYYDPNEMFSVADASGATAVHPGYGFFAEDHRFARRASERSRPLVFIGPSWSVIRNLGDKINTKRLARSLNIPTIPGSDRPLYDEIEAEAIAQALFSFQIEQGIHKPVVLVKASAGGGGMGIEEVSDPDKFRSIFRRVRNYAKRQFRDEGVLVEQRIFDFNHLEVQIVAERNGTNVVHFGTRNCSVQSIGRQKRIEVAPGFAPQFVTYAFDAADVLDSIINHSLSMAREVRYDNVGTWEWIVTPNGQPFLLEVNTRIQVENGVSAIISRVPGKEHVDLIAEQIRLGLGDSLGYTQKDVVFEGVGIEYRIIAEEPHNKFAPWVGRIERFQWKEEPWVRVYSHVPTDRPYEIPTEFDPNLALGIVWGETLHQARERGQSFLDNLVLEGRNTRGEPLQSNIAYLHAKTDMLLMF
ncbi:Biotin carboxylase C-terminal domain-containing protein [Desulfonatronum thiosulfatophilum]|uniref:biotin carboxylase n=1 Tax=Desulfonatronum thiosulfatophilum TaxID=617002 RepID=A0A1G6D285_9BACT|nr:biotin carboxylase N-terminal domain-containing protein [Desulfonatronum thiosulfatophilum]SDB39220.1 Biotin carboxylase C-terminal domain-containing protein [Desulfonatronum thiosulfatophilum]